MASHSSDSPVSRTEPSILDLAPAPPADTAAIEHTAELFKALAAPSRLRILLILADGSATVSTIVDATGLSQPLVSQHLKLLRGLHLVAVRRLGREAYYSLKDEHVAHIIRDALAHTEEGHHHDDD